MGLTGLYDSLACVLASLINNNTQVMFIRESGLMFRSFAQFLFKMTFSRGDGGAQNDFGNSGEVGGGGGVIFLLKK